MNYAERQTWTWIYNTLPPEMKTWVQLMSNDLGTARLRKKIKELEEAISGQIEAKE